MSSQGWETFIQKYKQEIRKKNYRVGELEYITYIEYEVPIFCTFVIYF